ncbi:MAG TPA: hypothetical protein VL991_13505 [Terracidiphilus sp.]|nr:hypothetical protein [Terracidiphilus sp.]
MSSRRPAIAISKEQTLCSNANTKLDHPIHILELVVYRDSDGMGISVMDRCEEMAGIGKLLRIRKRDLGIRSFLHTEAAELSPAAKKFLHAAVTRKEVWARLRNQLLTKSSNSACNVFSIITLQLSRAGKS